MSLLAKLAVDLEDPVLARRAARLAAGSARLLSGLDFPAGTDDHDDEDQPLPEVEDLLERMHDQLHDDDWPADRLPTRTELRA